MPKGQKLIDWTPENDARLMLTILAVENVHPNCEAVATAFGGAVNAMAIANHLSRLRKKATDEGFVPKGGVAASTKGNKGNGVKKNRKTGDKGGKVAEGFEIEHRDSVHENSDFPPTTKNRTKGQKVLTGRVTKARASATKTGKGTVRVSDDNSNEHGNDEPGNDKLDSAEKSGSENEFSDAKDTAMCIKSEEEGDREY